MARNIDFPIYTIQKTGDDAERINFLFLAEGYKKDELDKFYNVIKEKIQTLLNYEPYKQFSHLFNIYAIFTNQDESGNNFFGITNNNNPIYTLPISGRMKIKKNS